MKNFFLACFALCILSIHATTSTISMVYNFRIAQITKQPIHEEKEPDKLHALTSLFFYQHEKKYTGGIEDSFAGLLEAFVYDFSQTTYLRTDMALSYVNETINHERTFSDVQTDDILITIGHVFTPHDKARLTFSGLFGIPTHVVYALLHPAFGYGQAGTGVQLDGLFKITKTINFLCGTRYLYFIPRTAQDAINNNYTFTIGNVADILVGLKSNWQSAHGLEGGYAVRWDFGANITPHFDYIVKKTNYTKNSFYLVYKYKFKTARVSHRFLWDIGYGFDSKSKIFGNQRTITTWLSWTINF